MRPGETLLEMARRHVDEGEAHVLKQRGIVARLNDIEADTSTAEHLLEQFEQALDDHRTTLGRMIEEQRLGRRDAAGEVVDAGIVGRR